MFKWTFNKIEGLNNTFKLTLGDNIGKFYYTFEKENNLTDFDVMIDWTLGNITEFNGTLDNDFNMTLGAVPNFESSDFLECSGD